MGVLKSIIISILLLSVITVSGQTPVGVTPMHTFLQKNADSTIIFKIETSWMEPPTYSIISKKIDTITLYTYKSMYRDSLKMPKSIRDTIYKLKRYQDYPESYNVGINNFFSAKYIDEKSAREFWTSLSKQSPWKILDDSVDGEGCPDYTKDKYTSDLGGVSLFLVTKDNIKHLYFYGPKFFEEKICKSRKGRKAILEIQKLFNNYFKG